MSGTLLERARGALEEVEALEQLAIETLNSKPSGAKAAMERDAILKNVVDGVGAASQTLGALYADADGAYRAEVMQMRGAGVFTNFYGALKETREYYARHAGTASFAAAQSPQQAAVERAKRVETAFSGEEMWGKYLDLADLHRQFCNIPGAPDGVDYVAYLRALGAAPFSKLVPQKGSGKYAKYALAADAYLSDFWRRTQPLVPLEPLLQEALAKVDVDTDTTTAGDALDLSKFGSAKDLEALGLDRLKRALAAKGLKVGGDAKQRAARLFSIKGVKDEDIDPKLKNKKRARENESSKKLDVARAEARVEALLTHLSPVLDATVRRAERKLTRTKDEIDAELADEEFGVDNAVEEEEEEEDNDMIDPLEQPIYNPKNLPLGWDGRPIPYWLYKLHGLDVAYVCEICGNQTYYGRRAFDQHFNEWRHSHGMRCLRIPNSKHFHGVVKMDDAVALWEQLQEKQEMEAFKPERDEEYEDSDGNVLNRATYEDLARQGLL